MKSIGCTERLPAALSMVTAHVAASGLGPSVTGTLHVALSVDGDDALRLAPEAEALLPRIAGLDNEVSDVAAPATFRCAPQPFQCVVRSVRFQSVVPSVTSG